ncbi:GNAT family N-acetyltransferase [Pelagivirga sediminicola]|uniref:GNAT family N-acetyltransferase n=1 Tax=Pelagivirga sediminicola TaxID=2170575 RepID=A0A2T7G510_9RHOB|nr:GNAT family N-acetyltransferase [Pelagivirga sediminicola]PVA09490.1 GNAT family N-acetyltransferase [Pelagivirga sediminicola]
MAGQVELRTLTGAALDAALDDVARLRIAVFRAYPYLYDGDAAYERRYLEIYRHSPGAILVGAFDGARLVGASTGTPLEDHADDFAAAFAGQGLDLTRIFYCAESVLLPEYRGQGAGHGFFDAREAHARALGRDAAVFCSVQRPEGHPLRPAGYASLDPFWRGRGYAPLPGAVAQFRWKDVDQDAETDHDLQFWMRRLDRI